MALLGPGEVKIQNIQDIFSSQLKRAPDEQEGVRAVLHWTKRPPASGISGPSALSTAWTL